MRFSPSGITTLLSVFDMTKSLQFYCEVLGFHVVSTSPEVDTAEGRFSHWVWLRSGPVELMLNTQYDSGERPQAQPQERSKAHSDTVLYIGCKDLDLAYRELSARGLRAETPRNTPYGLRIFSTSDPDGYMIVFQSLPQS